MTEEDRKNRQAKQVVVVRKDLKMPLAKFSAQVAHAVLEAFMSFSEKKENGLFFDWSEKKALRQWLSGGEKKVLLEVHSEEELLDVYYKAILKELPAALITDAGATFFKEPTKTCVGIGPVYPEELVGITDKLKLYR